MDFLNDKPADQPLRVAIYLRVSTLMQEQDGRSPESQLQDMQLFCQRRNWSIAHVYREKAVSGRLSRRPALQQLLRHARDGKFDVVMVYYISRFYRKLESLLATLRFLNTCHITFVSYNENLDFTSRWGKLILSVLGSLAEIYVDELSETTSRGKQQRASDGLYNGSIPTGYCNGLCHACSDPNGPGYCPRVGQPPLGDGQTPVPHPLESQAIKLAFEWYASGQFSDADIAFKLNQAQVDYLGHSYALRPKRKPADRKRYGHTPQFGHETVREILTRIFYTGQVVYYGGQGVAEERRKSSHPQGIYPGRHQPLIEPALFDQVQALRQQRRFAAVRTDPNRVYPLTGLLTAWPDGAKMRGVTNGSGNRFYRDTSRIGRSKLDPSPRSGQPNLPAELIEQQVFHLFQQLTLPPAWQQRILAYLAAGDDLGLAELNRRRRDLLERVDTLNYLLLEKHISRQQHEQEMARLRAALDRLDLPDHVDQPALQALLANPADLWAQATPLELKGFYQLVFDQLMVRDQRLVQVDIRQPFQPFLPPAEPAPLDPTDTGPVAPVV